MLLGRVRGGPPRGQLPSVAVEWYTVKQLVSAEPSKANACFYYERLLYLMTQVFSMHGKRPCTRPIIGAAHAVQQPYI